MEEALPAFLSIGVSEEKFMDSTPNELEPYLKAFEIREKRKDEYAWQFNLYTMSAVMTAMERCIAGRKSKAKYTEEPFSRKAERERKEKEDALTEAEKKKERDALLMKLQVWQANFELSHQGGKGGGAS